MLRNLASEFPRNEKEVIDPECNVRASSSTSAYLAGLSIYGVMTTP